MHPLQDILFKVQAKMTPSQILAFTDGGVNEY